MLFLIFLVKKQSLYFWKLANFVPILKISVGSTFFEFYSHFFAQFKKTLSKNPWNFGNDRWILLVDIRFRSFAKKLFFGLGVQNFAWDVWTKNFVSCF